MSTTTEKQYKFISYLQQVFAEAKLETKLEEPSNEANFYTLIVRFGSVGSESYTVDLQLSFVPLTPESNFHLLQFFVEVYAEVKAEATHELLVLLNHLNGKLPIGSFGLFLDKHLLYFKSNCMLGEDIDQNLRLYLILVERQCDLILGTLNSFMADLVNVANCELTAQAALQKSQFSHLFA